MEPIVDLFSLPLHAIDRHEVVRRVEAAHAEGRGGWILTPNVELIQQASEDEAIRALYERADLRVTDGMPILWLARVAGRPLPDRVAGSDLVWSLAEYAGRTGQRLFLLGGDEGVAEAAGEVLTKHAPGLVVAGHASPFIALPPRPEQLAEIEQVLREAEPDLVYVAFGSPKTEYLIDGLRDAFPETWFLGCGISLSFITGDVSRAPAWVQRIGLEWMHRLVQEPRRLARRYLGRNLPFVLRGLVAALRVRFGSATQI